MIKSSYKKEDIEKFVSEKFDSSITLTPVIEGMESQVYSYTLNNYEYIIRISKNLEGFKKDKYAYENFNSANIPIPKVFYLGSFSETHYYCISEKIHGITFEDSKEEVVEELLPDITKIMNCINEIDISGTKGYGVFLSDTGNAPFSSWRDYLLDIINNTKYNWEEIKKINCIDNALIDNMIESFKCLLPYCNEVRKLRHGDYGSNNMIVSDISKFNGVIDWDCAGYGDPLYEVSSSFFWSTWLMCMNKVYNYWKKIYKNTPNFDAIIKCYAIHIGLVEIYENSIDKDFESLCWIQNRCKEILYQ